MMRVLAIDPGTSCGWAVMQRDDKGERTDGSAWHLKPQRHEGAGMRFLKLERQLDEISVWWGPFDVVFFEDVRGHRSTYAAQIYGGIVGVIEGWCERHGIPYQGIHTAKVKKHATGKGNASKSEMIVACEQKLGVLPRCDNEADARWLLAYGVKSLEGGGCREEEVR